jgi:hypothetical protein
MRFEPKDPSETLDYTHNWAAQLNGDTIATSTWRVEGGGATKGDESDTDTTATVFVSGGQDGSEALLINDIVTAGGRTMQRTSVLPIRSR